MLGKALTLAAAGNAGEETDENFNQTVLLLHGDGTNGAQNNTFLDSSTNNFTITRNGNTTQGTFSPFSAPDGRWSNYFDGANDWLNLANNADFDFGSGDLTIECWFYLTGNNAANPGGTRSAHIFVAFPNSGTRVDDYNLSITGDASTTGTGLTFRTTISDSPQSTTYTATITKNTWHHFAAVKSGNTVSLFYDGVRVQQNASVTNEVNSGGNPIKIGALRYTDGGGLLYDSSFPGYISNLRVLNGTALYSGTTYTVPTGPLTAIANTVLLTCQSNRFVDNSTNNFAITRNGDVKITPFSPFAPTAAYDASVNGGSGYFDGSGDYLDASSTLKDLGTGDFCIEFWVYTAATDAMIVDTRSDTNVGWMIYIDTTIKFYHDGSSRVTGSIKLNAWNHVAVTRSSGTLRLFVNGAQADSTTYTANLSDGDDFRIADKTNSNSTVADLNGYLSSFRIVAGSAVYTSAFTPPTAPTTAIANTSLLLNFTNAGIFDNTGKNNLETVGNAQIDTTTKKYGTGSMEFDGTGDYLYQSVSSQDLTLGSGDWTIEMFVYLNSLPTSGNFFHLLDQRPAATNGIYPNINIDNSGSVRWFINDLVAISSPSSSIGTGSFYHVAICKSSGSTKMFLDGTQVGSTYSDTNNYLNSRTTIGGSSFNLGAGGLNGYIDDYRITKGVARYTTTFTPPTKAFPDL